MRILCLTAAVMTYCFVSLSCWSTEGQSNRGANQQPERPAAPKEGAAVLSVLRESNIKAFGEWDVGEDFPVLFVVIKSDDADKFFVQDKTGKLLYENVGINIQRVYPVTALRLPRSQLVFEYDEGGSDSFVQMLDYHDGKVSEKIGSTQGENSFGADVEIRPQFRTTIDPAREPFEIFLTEYGLASPAGKYTNVLRYKNGTYRVVGAFDRVKAGNCVESLLINR